MARINSDGSLAWMILTEGPLFSRVFWDNALDADGPLWVATSPGVTQFVDVPNAPAISENTRLLALNSSTGEVLLADELSVIPEAANKVNVLERDQAGILWTYVSYGGSQSTSTEDYEVTPGYGILARSLMPSMGYAFVPSCSGVSLTVIVNKNTTYSSVNANGVYDLTL